MLGHAWVTWEADQASGMCRHAILGCILVKELAWIDKTQPVPIASLKMRSIPTLPMSIALYDLLRLFRVRTRSMVIDVDGIIGVCTQSCRAITPAPSCSDCTAPAGFYAGCILVTDGAVSCGAAGTASAAAAVRGE